MNEMLPPEMGETTDHDAAQQPVVQTDIRDLTLLELLDAFRSAPRETWAVFRELIREDRFVANNKLVVHTKPAPEQRTDGAQSHFRRIFHEISQSGILLRAAALLLALAGSLILTSAPTVRRTEAVELAQGTPFLLAGFGLWLLAEILSVRYALRDWWQHKDSIARIIVLMRLIPILLMIFAVALLWDAMDVPPDQVVGQVIPGVELLLAGAGLWLIMDAVTEVLRWFVRHRPNLLPEWLGTTLAERWTASSSAPDTAREDVLPLYLRINPLRLIVAFFAMVGSVLTWFGTTGNSISTPVFYLWLLSVALWAYAFAPAHWNPLEWLLSRLGWARALRWREHAPVIAAFLLILAAGIWFRFYQLDAHPLEMTDDHVEKILDAGAVRDGQHQIFFANNGGREPFQMYAIALASNLPGLGINHYTIKFVAVIESIITLPVMFWLGYELLAGESRQRRILMGLLLAGLVAGSYWHVAITRLGLRIVLTPLVSALLLIYLARALRRNQRADFIKAGLVLGFGLYMYQAVRMLPVVIVVAVAIAFYFAVRSWRDRLRYAINLLLLVWISLAVFLPMLHYSVEYPDLFWRRTAGRLLGDDIIEETRPDGTIVMRDATLDERINAFRENVPVLMSNIRNALLMFNWKGDVATINGVPNQPTLDIFSGALLIVGSAAWIVFMVQRRDVVYWLIPVFIFIMLLPSALSIAFPVENPSHTRTSGAMPAVYLVAALPMVLAADSLWRQSADRRRQALVVAGCGLLLFGSFRANTQTYFEVYPEVYTSSFHPYTAAGNYLRGFVLTGGSYGNAFMIGYPHWWSHRAIGLASGLEEQWTNGIVARTDIPAFLRDASGRNDRFRFDPQRDILFFFSPEDTETGAYLAELFPTGYVREEVTYKPQENYMVFRVPALGPEAFAAWLLNHL